MPDEITEFEKMEAERVDGVGAPANGTEFLFMKSMSDTDDDAREKDDDKDGDGDDDADDKSMKGAFCGDETCAVCQFVFGGDMEKAKLSGAERKRLPKSSFAIPDKAPGSGSYPIHDKAHARDALSRVAQNGNPEEKKRVRAAVARKFPGIGKPKAAKAVPSGHAGQTDAVHAGRPTGAVHMDTQRPEGVPSRPDAGNINGEHDGGGDTAPDKDLYRDEAEGQTRDNARKSESTGAEHPQAVRNVDMTGDKAGASGDGRAEAEARTQTITVTHQTKGGVAAESERMMNYARTGSYKSAQELDEAALALVEKAHGLLPEGTEGSASASSEQLRLARRLLKTLAKTQRLAHPTQEIEKMNQEELVALLDQRDAMKAKQAKKASKKAAKAERKAAQKAAEDKTNHSAPAGEEAAEAAKSAPVLDVDAIANSIGEAVKSQLEPLARRVEQVEKEDSRSRPRPAISDLAGNTAVRRGDMSKEQAEKGLDDMQKAFEDEKDADRKAKLGSQLTVARLTIQERLRHGRPAPQTS